MIWAVIWAAVRTSALPGHWEQSGNLLGVGGRHHAKYQIMTRRERNTDSTRAVRITAYAMYKFTLVRVRRSITSAIVLAAMGPM